MPDNLACRRKVDNEPIFLVSQHHCCSSGLVRRPRQGTAEGSRLDQTSKKWAASSSPGEFHPQALTEPDGRLATHPALHTQPRAKRSRSISSISSSPYGLTSQEHDPAPGFVSLVNSSPCGLLHHRNRVYGPLRSMPITGTSSLLQAHPPLCRASVLSASGVIPLSLSLRIEATGSQVTCSSPNRNHATLMPDATRVVSGSLPCFSRSNDSTPVLTSSLCFRHVVSGSLAFVFPILT